RRRTGGLEISRADVTCSQVCIGDAEAQIRPNREGRVPGGVAVGMRKEVGQGERAVGMIIQRIVERAQAQGLVRVFHRPLMLLTVSADERAEAKGHRELWFRARARSSTSTAAS